MAHLEKCDQILVITLRFNEIKMCAALGCQSEREVKSVWTAVVINVLIARWDQFVYLLYVI